MTSPRAGSAADRVHKVAHEARFRTVSVVDKQNLSPGFIRLVLGGDQLADFQSLAADDHVKVVLPDPETGELIVPELRQDGPHLPDGSPRPAMRDYTVRRFDPASQRLTIDFLRHGDGPASTWAEAACPGDVVGIGGPRSSRMVANDFDWYLLIGDETALPAIYRRIEEAEPRMRIKALIEVPTSADRLELHHECELELNWLVRDEGAKGLENALSSMAPWDGDFFAFAAAEKQVSKALKRILLNEFGANDDWMKVSGYWTRKALAD